MKPQLNITDERAASAYAALMRELPIHSENDSPELAEVFAELDSLSEILNPPSEDDDQ